MPAAASAPLLVEDVAPHVIQVAFNRPEVRNAIDTATMIALRDFFAPLEFTPGALRCIILTGVGDKAFSAGGDLKERNGMSDDDWRRQHAIAEEGAKAILDCPVPVIAAVNGAAFGGGCELALCCDFILAARHARFALPEVTRGIMPGGGGTQNLPRAIGERRAKQFILTGASFAADDAFAWGMVNEVCEAEALMPRAREIAGLIAANAPIAVRQAKKAIHHGLQADIHTGMVFEIQAYERMIASEDRLEGVRAFGEKRKPVFHGR
jgi:enoyl-CoA hydratase/carnithine racemase